MNTALNFRFPAAMPLGGFDYDSQVAPRRPPSSGSKSGSGSGWGLVGERETPAFLRKLTAGG